jgi:hypothetical protein
MYTQAIVSPSSVLSWIRWYFLLLSVTGREKTRILILVKRCNRVLSVVHRDVSCGNNVHIKLNINSFIIFEMWIWRLKKFLIRSFYVQTLFAILKFHDKPNALRTATATKVIFHNSYNNISTSKVSALWQINSTLWYPSGQYAMWMPQFNLTSPEVVARKVFKNFCFGIKWRGCGVELRTHNPAVGLRQGHYRTFVVTSCWIFHGIRKVSYTVVAKTKVHIYCEFTVYKAFAERTPDHSWCTNTSQISDFFIRKIQKLYHNIEYILLSAD